MKLKNLVQTMTLSILASAMLIGCGGGSDSAAPVDDIQTGTFIDAPVKGLYFKTATQQGYTNDSGEFSYKAGETVEFKLGNLSLGTVSAGDLISPYKMAGILSSSDSNISTNIALLLQNLDGNRTNTAMLDVSKLKDMNLSDFNLSVGSATFETLLSNKLTAGNFDNYINSNDKSLLTIATVKQSMKTFVQSKEAEINNPTKLIGKSYVGIEGNDILGYEKRDFTLVWNDSTVSGKYEGDSFSGSYTVTADKIIKITFDDGDTDNIKIIDFSPNVVAVCSADTEEEAKACTEATSYWVASNIADTFIATKNSTSTTILKNKSLVTNFSELQNKTFGHINGHSTFSINQNGDISSTDFAQGNTSYKATFNNGALNITGIDTYQNNEALDDTYAVYKYDLTGAILNEKQFSQLFYNNAQYSNKIYTFTSGSMYCSMLWDQCWLDETATAQANSK